MIIPSNAIEHCLKALSLVYNRSGEPGVQEDQDFELLVQGESVPDLIDLVMTLAAVAAAVVESIPEIYDGLISGGMIDEDPLDQGHFILDAMRDTLIDQGVNESS